jgi:hypothetical protein
MDEQSYVTRVELENTVTRVEERMSKRICGIELEVKEHGKSITRIETVLANLEDLPTILSNLNVTLVRLDGRMCNVESGIAKLEAHTTTQGSEIDRIEEKGKIDWMDAVKKNWWAIILFVAAVIMLLKSQGVF